MTAGVHSSDAQALYLDPTRTDANSGRRITAATNAYGSVNKKYEGNNQADVPGVNFPGTGTTADDITILALPAVPTFTPTQPTCEVPTGTITVNTPANGTGIKYTLTGTNPITAPVDSTTGVFSGLVAGKYKVTTTNSEGCTSLPTADITINALAGAPTTTGVSICQGDNTGAALIVTSACSSGTIQWFTEASGGTAIFTGSSFNPLVVTESGLTDTNTAKTVIYYASCSGSCRTATSYVIKPKPTITATTPNSRCDAGTVILGATASSGTINWYAASTGGPSLGTGSSFTTPSLSTTTDYYVDATDNGCTTVARTLIKATVNTLPTINSTTEGSRCGEGAVTLKATASAGATINWYANPTGGASLGSGGTFTTPSLSSTTTYYVGATTAEGCTTASRIAVAAVINTASTITFTSGTQNPTVCTGITIPTAVYTFGGSAINATASNLPTGVTSTVDSDAKTITISGTPTVSGTYKYTITTVGHTSPCIAITIDGTITVTANNTVNAASATPTLCINTVLTNITHTTTGATGIGTAAGLPSGVSAAWASNKITISGTPTASGVFDYTIPLTGGCGAINATGKITVTANNTVSVASATPTLCINTVLTNITHTTTGATGIGTATGLPSGVSAAWASNTITISGTPTASGVFDYTIPLTGGCGAVNATGKITVTANNTVSVASATPTLCTNTVLTNITHTTTGATGIGTATGLPSGVSAAWASNKITISGTPTASGVFDYTIPLTGGCGAINATGKITVTANNTVSVASATPTLCINTVLTNITHTTTGATGIGTATGLPSGVSAAWASNTITISGTPTASGVFDYTIPLTGGCGAVNATGKITVTANNTVSVASATPTLCTNTVLTNITHTTTGATGIGTATGLPSGVSAAWASNKITISGTPTASGVFDYTIPLTGGCGAINATGKITVTANNTVSVASATPTLCINTVLTNITHTTTGATGIGTATGLPLGVSAAWASNTITISGTPTASGVFDYTIPLTGGCGAVNATGKITVTANNTVSVASATPTLCINTVLTNITHTTTGATGIGTATGLPLGVSAAWASNTITISGTPTASGVFDYTIPLTGGCGAVNATGKITVTANNTVSVASATPTLCINTVLTNITHTTTGATGIGTATGLPSGVSAAWASNTITISGTPTASGVFDYTIPLTGGCGAINAAGKITVTGNNTVSAASATPTLCINTVLTNITHTTTGATGIGTATGLPSGVSAAWASNMITISGTPTASGVFDYTIPLTGGCGAVNATGKITVTGNNTVSAASATPTLCINTVLTNITHTTTGATGIGTATGLPSGVSAAWASNMITISGTPTASGVFDYTIPLTGGCGTINATGKITVTAAPNAGILSGTQDICVASTTTFTSNGDAGSWSSSDTAIAMVDSSTGVITGKAAGTATITYTVTGTGGCTNATATRTVKVTTAPNAGILSGTQDICVASTTTFTSNGDAGSWSSSDTAIATVDSSTGVITGKAAGTATITYTVTGTGGCTTTTATRTVKVTTAPNAGILSGTQDICVASTTTFTSNGDAGSWSSSDTAIATVDSSTGVITGKAAGTATITYTVTGTGGCTTTTATRTVKVTAAPNAGTLSGAQDICVASTTTFTSNGDAGSWSSSDTAIATVDSSTGVITGKAAGTATITYTVTGTGGCTTTTATRTVKVTDAPNAGTLSGAQDICVASTTTFTSNGDAGSWSSSDTAIATVDSSTGVITGKAAGTATITYTVTGTGGCTNATATRTVTVTAAPNAGTLSGAQDICVASTTTFTSNGDAGSWSSSDTAIATVDSSTGVITGKAAGTATITYTVTGTGGCTNATATRTVTVTAAPNAGILSGTQDICVASTTTFTSNGDAGSWSSSDTAIATVDSSTGVITGKAAGTATITYTVTGTGGCTNATATRTVTVTAAPNAGILSGTQDICVASTTTFTSNGDAGSWSSSDTAIATVDSSTGVITGKAAGTATITYTVTGTGGCTNATATRTVTVTAAPNAGILSGAQDICVASTTTFTSNGDAGSWSSSDTAIATVDSSTGVITGKASGTATITYTVIGTGGCTSASSSRIVTVETPSKPLLSTVAQQTCTTATGSLTITNYDVNYTYIITPSTGIVQNEDTIIAPVGNYIITASVNGCISDSSSFIIDSKICANDDTYPAQVPGTTVATTVGNVITNDKLNGEDVTATNTTVTPITTGPLTIDANGELTLAPNTTSGEYKITYQICEKGANPVNCDTAEVTVVVKGTLVANDDTYPAQVPGTTVATTVGNVTVNDKLNGEDVTAANTIVTSITTGPLTIDANGELTLAPNTTSGEYKITYQICEKGANPVNCDTAEVTVVVKGTLVANEDTYPAQVPGTTVATTVGNVTVNDKLNGEDVTAVNTTVTPITTGPLTIDANGELTLAPNTTSGEYKITYQICEKGANPVNCDTAEVTVVVKGTLVANDDTYPAQVPGTTVATTVGNVITNDKLNGEDVTATNTTVTPITTGPLTIDADGKLTLAPNTTSGEYKITYQICEKGANPVNCDTAEVTVVVKGTLVANDDTYPAQVPGTTVATTVGNVITNDKLNGEDVTAVNITVTPITTGPLTIDANGELTLAPNTTSGEYKITYQICEKGANPVNCDTAEVTVVVKGTLVANDDTYPAQVPGTTVATTVGNVTVNDKLNGEDVTAANTTVTPITTGPLTIDADGELTLAPNTVSGEYKITYQICEKGANPVNCDTAEVTVVVKGTLVATDDSYTATPSATLATTVGNVTVNDKLNGEDVTATNTTVTPITTGPLTIDADGKLTLAPNTTSGEYKITYQICEKGANPVNCDTAEVTVVVKGTLVANDDTYPAQVPGTTVATTVGNVITNDKLNGEDVTAVNITVTPITTGPLTIDANGELTLAPNTTSGEYKITYQICEKGTSNCDTAEVTVVVENGSIIAPTITTAPINGSIGGTTVSLIDNVTLNGNPAVIKNSNGGVILTAVKVPTGLILNPDGTVTVKPGTPIGNYEIEYTICEYLNPTTNCVTVKSYVPVTGAALKANNDNAGTVDSSKGQSSTTSIFDNDTLNGSKVNPADLVLTTLVRNPNLILKADGTIEVKPGTPTGTYELTYQICEALNPTINCSQAIAKISVVNNPPITPLIQIIANNDGTVNVDGINGALEFINVLDNDLIKGLPINPLEIILSNTPSPYFEFNSDGTVNVKPNTPGGMYSLTYQVCEKSNQTNCASAILSVFVEVPSVAIIKTAVFNDENGSGFANAGETITYKFKVTNTGNVPLKGVMISDPLPGVVVSGQAINLEVNESDEHNFTATYKITQSDINKGSVSNQASVQARSAKGVLVEDLSDDENETGDKPTVLALNGCLIKVFNAFSPNGDEKNTRFYIQGLECYPDNTVEIYNRWGVLVYDINNYNNEDRAFVGFSEGRTTVKKSEGLPVGTYFYILKYKDNDSNPHELSGYLYINK
ncbi:Ig-like domain-containing protein [Flavobacterium sp. F-30]|uniref:Ig-like domain-containing protein n=2 Tax=Flavobacterium piscisymbiosum TaxID=2893753 RepID=A0ABS8MCB3_9FLAO|nr:Ig-like domain-containing protein [Flavobacterium sp. F-30]